MPDVMALALQALAADAAGIARIGANLANAQTPGYKREIGVVRGLAAPASFQAIVERQTGVAAGALSGSTPELHRDLRAGSLRSTGQPFDLALAGSGYFEVSTPTGPAYTRHGQFRLDAHGRIVTQQGHVVAGSGGDVLLTSATPSIDAAGAVREDGRLVAKLRIVDFADAGRLERAEGGLYGSDVAPLPLEDAQVQVRQGYLENANVEPMREMVDLVRTMRRFESVYRAVQIYDDLLGTGIRKLGEN